MPYEDDDDQSNESGGQLRAKLEEALKGNTDLKSQLAELKAEKLVTEKGLTTIRPEDLKGVELDKLEETATALHAERLVLQKDLLRNAYMQQGYEGEALERMVAGIQPAAAALSSVRSVGKLDGIAVPAVDPRELTPTAKMEWGLQANKRKA